MISKWNRRFRNAKAMIDYRGKALENVYIKNMGAPPAGINLTILIQLICNTSTCSSSSSRWMPTIGLTKNHWKGVWSTHQWWFLSNFSCRAQPLPNSLAHLPIKWDRKLSLRISTSSKRPIRSIRMVMMRIQTLTLVILGKMKIVALKPLNTKAKKQKQRRGRNILRMKKSSTSIVRLLSFLNFITWAISNNLIHMESSIPITKSTHTLPIPNHNTPTLWIKCTLWTLPWPIRCS